MRPANFGRYGNDLCQLDLPSLGKTQGDSPWRPAVPCSWARRCAPELGG